jgi:hypothetical protein
MRAEGRYRALIPHPSERGCLPVAWKIRKIGKNAGVDFIRLPASQTLQVACSNARSDGSRTRFAVQLRTSFIKRRADQAMRSPNRPGESVVAFDNDHGMAEQGIKEGKGAITWSRRAVNRR